MSSPSGPRRPQAGPWRPSTAFQSTPRAGSAPPIMRPSFVSNAYTPQIDIGLAAGFAMLFAVGLASSNTAQAAEYQFGTHAAAIYESQFKGAIWGPAQAAAVTPKTLGAFLAPPPQADTSQIAASIFRPLSGQTPPRLAPLIAAPQSVDLTLQGVYFKPTPAPQGRVPQIAAASQTDISQIGAQFFAPQPPPIIVAYAVARISGAPQADPSQPAPSIFAPITGHTPPRVGPLIAAPQTDPTQTSAQLLAPLLAGQTPPRIGPIVAAPQSVDLTIQGWTIAPVIAQGRTPPMQLGAPQADPTQIPAQVFPSLRTPPIVPNPIAGFVSTLPQFEERVTQTVLPSLRAGATVRVPPFIAIPPQWVDLTIQGWIEAPQAAIQGRAPPLAVGQPQADPTQIAAQFFPSLRAPPIVPNPIAGFFTTLPQFEERVTQVVLPSLRAGSKPTVPPLILIGPQLIDLTVQGFSLAPQAAPQGRVPALTLGAPQSDPSQIPALIVRPATVVVAAYAPIATLTAGPQADLSQIAGQFFTPARTQIVVQFQVPRLLSAAPQFEERTTAIAWPPARAGQRPPHIASLWAAPQFIDLTIQGFTVGPKTLKNLAISWVTPHLLGPADGRFTALRQGDPTLMALGPTDGRFFALAARDIFKLT